MKLSTATEVQAALAAQSKDSFNLLLLQKKLEDDVKSGDSAALEKDIAELSTTYRHFVYQDRALRHSNLDGKLLDQVERDQYTLGQNYKNLELKARAAVKVSGQGIEIQDSTKLTGDLLMTISDANKMANGSSDASAASTALKKAVDSLGEMRSSAWAKVEYDIEHHDTVHLKTDMDRLNRLYADVQRSISTLQASGADSGLLAKLKSAIGVMSSGIDNMRHGKSVGPASTDFAYAMNDGIDALQALQKSTTDKANAAKALAAQSKDVADIAALRKTISGDAKNDHTKIEADKVALHAAYDDLVKQNDILKASGADTKLIEALTAQQANIKTGIDALGAAADGGEELDATADAALIAALKSAMELITKMG